MEKEFLGYSREWAESVMKREGFDKKLKNKMLLSQETLTGLHMTGEFYYVFIYPDLFNIQFIHLLG